MYFMSRDPVRVYKYKCLHNLNDRKIYYVDNTLYFAHNYPVKE